ncbi:MAG: bifunctional oligoribonuclease/PAP phosphatase NrnA [Bacteroidota bacterium]
MFFTRSNIEKARNEIQGAKSIVLTAHKSPDGDALGSALGMKKFLENLGKKVEVILPDEFPRNFAFLPGELLIYDNDQGRAKQIISESDIVFCLDYNNLGRIGDMKEALQNYNGTKILIDHHTFPSDEFDLLFSAPQTGSTCELVFEFIQDLDEYHCIDRDVATCLMTGLITDTGSFRYGTNANTFKVASHLLKEGADIEEIQKKIFDNNSLDSLRLKGYAILEKLELIGNGKIALLGLNENELEQFNYQKGDTEGLVNKALSIAGVEIAVFVSDRKGETRLSFRSKNAVKVNGIASEHFMGGGHEKAAGGRSDHNVADTIEKLKRILPEHV